MSKPPKAFDVWFVSANTVYKGVPYSVVSDWAQEGRLGAADMVKAAGSNLPWQALGRNEFLSDYLPRSGPAVAVPAEADASQVASPAAVEAATGEHADLPEPEPVAMPHEEADDEVDMIPLIDVSMVLLVFFIIMRAAGAVAPVDVPEMKFGGQVSNDPEAITINIDKKNEDTVIYSLRVGQATPKPEHDNLAKPEEALKALDDLLASAQSAPEVRIACRKDLPRERVYEIRRLLEEYHKAHKINSFSATVIEAPKEEK